MLTKNLTVVNPSGLHLRPAGVLSQTAMKFKSDVIIESGEKRIVAKSVLNVRYRDYPDLRRRGRGRGYEDHF